MNNEGNVGIEEYNSFCKEMHEGCILYNVDRTNHWGEYFLVANVSSVTIDSNKTYSMLLIGLKKQDGTFVPRDIKIRITPDSAQNIPFLKYVGRCKFTLNPEVKDVNVNMGLVVVYKDIDLRKYTQKLHIRKPKAKRYGSGGELLIDNQL